MDGAHLLRPILACPAVCPRLRTPLRPARRLRRLEAPRTEYRAPQEAMKSRAIPAGEAGDRNLLPGRAACVGGTGPEATYARALNWTVKALGHGRRPPIWTCWRAAMREKARDICFQLSGRAYVGACVCYTSQQVAKTCVLRQWPRSFALTPSSADACWTERSMNLLVPATKSLSIAFESPIPIGSI